MQKTLKKTIAKVVIVAGLVLSGCNSGSAGSASSGVAYANFQTYTNAPGSSTYITGVRNVNDGSGNVYLTGLYQPESGTLFNALIYTGPVAGGGSWVELNNPGGVGESVTSTSFYGPDSDALGNITAVGCYTTLESGAKQIGLLYQGTVAGVGTWTTLTPPENLFPSVENTIAHSTMGGLVVGNTTNNSGVSKGFLYNINNESYVNINLPGHSVGVTAYGIWYNGITSYTIAGGYSDVNESGFDVAYLIDYNSASGKFSNFESYSYNNQPSTTILSHFEGITRDDKGGYNLAADVESAGLPLTTAFVHVTRNSDTSFNSNATWTEVLYPNAQVTSANTVYQNNILGVYSVVSGDGIKIPFIATIQ